MGVVPVIVQALDTAHQVWKLRGVQSRPLLALLIKFDNGRYLNEGSRERIVSDIAAFTLVTSSHSIAIVGISQFEAAGAGTYRGTFRSCT